MNVLLITSEAGQRNNIPLVLDTLYMGVFTLTVNDNLLQAFDQVKNGSYDAILVSNHVRARPNSASILDGHKLIEEWCNSNNIITPLYKLTTTIPSIELIDFFRRLNTDVIDVEVL